MDADSRIVDADAVPEDGSVRFTLTEGAETTEAILLRLADGIVAFENYCPHWRRAPRQGVGRDAAERRTRL